MQSVTAGEQTLGMQGIVLKRAPTLCPIRDENWFCSQIERCEDRLRQMRVEAQTETETETEAVTTPQSTWFDRMVAAV